MDHVLQLSAVSFLELDRNTRIQAVSRKTAALDEYAEFGQRLQATDAWPALSSLDVHAFRRIWKCDDDGSAGVQEDIHPFIREERTKRISFRHRKSGAHDTTRMSRSRWVHAAPVMTIGDRSGSPSKNARQRTPQRLEAMYADDTIGERMRIGRLFIPLRSKTTREQSDVLLHDLPGATLPRLPPPEILLVPSVCF